MICARYTHLLHDVFIASSNYHQATTRLVDLAGKSEPHLFQQQLHSCKTCAQDCRRTATALRSHIADHGCATEGSCEAKRTFRLQ